MKLALLLLVLASACVKSNAVACDGDRLCPEGTACDETHKLCVAPDQITACDGKADRDACTYATGSGNCHDGVCLPGICGNGVVDGLEQCDDGNVADGDGCSADCLSDETCGNGTIDLAAGEECDDSNHVDRDGCDSSCAHETMEWALYGDPGPRSQARAAYDPTRGKVVMFGGDSAYHLTTDTTSEWDGQWRSAIRTVPPPNRSGFGMAYFGPSHHVVIQGGTTGGQVPRHDTWDWDGSTWRQLADGPPRSGQAMAYDAKRKKIVMFGGRGNAATLAETWEFDGTAWTTMSPATSPNPTEDAAMTFDPDRGVIVMHGGSGTGGETWEYDGTTWTNRSSFGVLPVLDEPKLAYCAKLHRVVEFGGFSGTAGTNHTYSWNGTAWTDLGAAPVAPRGGSVLVEDGKGNVLLYGGRTADTVGIASIGETWLFDGSTWTPLTATPFPRQEMAFAASLSKVVVFSGRTNQATSLLSDTWELTTRGWKQFPDGPGATDAPPPTSLAQIVYDEQHDTFVMFGGIKNGSTLDDTTWIRSGSTWSFIHPTPSPAGRGAFGFAYDGARHEAVLFGGVLASSMPSGETWTFDGTKWTLKTPAHSPPARGAHAMAYDPATRVVVLVGGNDGIVQDGFHDTWFWDGTDWTEVTPAGESLSAKFYPGTMLWNDGALLYLGGISSIQFDTFETWQLVHPSDPARRGWQQIGTFSRPPGRAFGMAFNSPDRSGVIVAGGETLAGATLFDQWLLSTSGSHPHDSCAFDIDLDGDGEVRCTDADCWPTCSPQCPPGASCLGTEPHCGDGTCSATESCHTCPADCTSCPNICGDFICDPGESCPGDCS